MKVKNKKIFNKIKRAKRARVKIRKNSVRPRLSVFRSNKYTYAQIIDDNKHATLASGSTSKIKNGTKTEKANLLGQQIAKKALEQGIVDVVFDKGPYKYHGRIKAAAEGARTGGLKF